VGGAVGKRRPVILMRYTRVAPSLIMHRMFAFWMAALIVLVTSSNVRTTVGAQTAPVRVANVRSGPWSSADTWGRGGVPSA
jgi:hypothetical protein